MSLWQIAQAAIRTRASPGPGAASSISSIVNGLPKARQTAALVFIVAYSVAKAPGWRGVVRTPPGPK
jgi:hypothetical protein